MKYINKTVGALTLVRDEEQNLSIIISSKNFISVEDLDKHINDLKQSRDRIIEILKS